VSDLVDSSRVGTSLSLAALYLQQGKIVGFPTETSYGLAVDPENIDAVDRLFDLKKRDSSKALLLLVENTNQLHSLVTAIPPRYLPLIKKYWPGPLTLIFPARESVYNKITAETKTVGVRISPHPVARQLVSAFRKPITATSANVSGKAPARSALEVLSYFGSGVDYVLDGGATTAGACSTIVGMQNSQLKVIRKGAIEIETLTG